MLFLDTTIQVIALASLQTQTSASSQPEPDSKWWFPRNWDVGQIVHTTSGPVIGHPAPNATTVSEYLGIPYAKAPVGNLRFGKPEPFRGRKVINGSAFVSDNQKGNLDVT